MPVSMSQLSRPALERGLGALSGLLAKAHAHAAAMKIDDAVLLQARLYPDMHPLVRQVQLVCDFAKGAVARLSGSDVPSIPDTEATFADLQARVGRTLDLVRSIAPEALDGSESRDIVIKAGPRTFPFDGQTYLLGFVLPNFYFHLATAYGILRHNGVEIGKMDFMGLSDRTG